VADLFLSYKAEDRARIAPLVQALETDGLSVWWDEHIGGGDEWRDTILRHLQSAKCVIVVWSRRSVGPHGEFVRDEATRALRRKTYLPIRIDKVDPPLGFGEMQALDLQGWKGDRSDPHYQSLLATVCKRIGKRTKSGPKVESHGISRRTFIASASAVGIAAAAAGTWILVRPSAAKADSIAVLPFANLSGDPAQGYFSDGIAEELRTALSRIPGLKVMARTSSEAVRNADAATAAARLHVQNILTGSVRRSPRMMRISAQLIDGKDGTERWSEVYDRPLGDVLQIQSDIAQKVATALAIRLGPAKARLLTSGGTRNPAAYDLFLKGVAVRQSGHTRDNLNEAIGLLSQATKYDPRYADAYAVKAIALAELAAGFANSTADMQRGYAEADRAARQAIALSPDTAYAHAALGTVMAGRLNLKAADDEFRIAAAQSPGNGLIVGDYGRFLGFLGQFDRALDFGRHAVSIDPLNARSYSIEMITYFYARRYPESVRAAHRVLSLAPESIPALITIGDALTEMGKYDDARANYSKIAADDVFRLTSEGVLDERTGNHAASEAAVRKVEQLYDGAASYQLAQLHAQRREADAAIAALEMGWQVKDPGLSSMRVDPFLDPIRNDPRFAAVAQKLNFPT
jgi:TolB-like protein/tetratricopeptide (TPR) repeat protein